MATCRARTSDRGTHFDTPRGFEEVTLGNVQYDPLLFPRADIRAGAAHPGDSLRHLGLQSRVSAEKVIVGMGGVISSMGSAHGTSECQTR